MTPDPDTRPSGDPATRIHLPARAALFDCDGVLVDSEDTVARSWGRWADFYRLDRQAVLGMVHGHRSADTVRMLLPAEQASAGAELIDAYELADAESVKALPGARELLEAMPAGSAAIVTSGTKALATARLQAARIGVPAVLISAEDVARGKPAPDPYLAGAAALGLAPSETVVVEDSANGIISARSAGVGHVVGVGERARSSDPDVVIADLRALSWDGKGLSVRAQGE